MSISFAEVGTTLAATETEVQEFDAAVQALAGARDNLVQAQDTVATAQTAVATAVDVEGTEKADVVSGITQAIGQLNAILATLQE